MSGTSRRNILLAGFMLATFSSQAIWVTFSPASTSIAEHLGVSKEKIGFLALLYPMLFLLLTIPSGILLDRSFKSSFLFGVMLTGLGGSLRLANPNNYNWLLTCQFIAGVAQPFILNAFVPFSSRFYPERKERIVSLLSLSMYLGIIYALGTGYTIYTRWGIIGLIAPIAAVSLIGTLLAFSTHNIITSGTTTTAIPERRRPLYELHIVTRFKDLWLLGIILGLGVALFDNMSIWLEAVLAEVGLGHVAGSSLAIALVAGLAGISFIPTIIAKNNIRTMYIRLVSIIATLSFTILALKTTNTSVIIIIPLIGFLMIPAYPIIMEWIATYHEPQIHGSATGFIGLTSRILTTILASIAITFLKSPANYFTFLAILSLAAFTTSLLLPSKR